MEWPSNKIVSVVIVTCGIKDYLKSCLDSIFDQDYQGFETIIVDNGSRDGTSDLIKEKYPWVILIENKQNLGACRARNQGIKESRGEWILTLDCDIILKKDFLFRLLNVIKDLSPQSGIIQPKILNVDRETTYSTGIFFSSIRRFYDMDKGKKDNGKFNRSRYVFGACSAAAVYNRQMLEAIKEDTGYFDERFFFLVEDVDLAWRAQKKGWKALFCPEAVCYHSGNSSNYEKIIRQYFCFRKRLLLIAKNEKTFGKIKLIPIFLLYDLPRALFILFNCRRLNLKEVICLG